MRFPRTQVIALVNQKGGCGKTSSSVAIAAAFCNLGYSACLADTDPQCNATESFGVRAESIVEDGKYTLADAYLKKRPATDIELDFGDRCVSTTLRQSGRKFTEESPLDLGVC